MSLCTGCRAGNGPGSTLGSLLARWVWVRTTHRDVQPFPADMLSTAKALEPSVGIDLNGVGCCPFIESTFDYLIFNGATLDTPTKLCDVQPSHCGQGANKALAPFRDIS